MRPYKRNKSFSITFACFSFISKSLHTCCLSLCGNLTITASISLMMNRLNHPNSFSRKFKRFPTRRETTKHFSFDLMWRHKCKIDQFSLLLKTFTYSKKWRFRLFHYITNNFISMQCNVCLLKFDLKMCNIRFFYHSEE